MSSDLVFQILDWYAADEEYDGGDSNSDEEGNNGVPQKYLVKVFGATEEGKTVAVNILNYTPYFYIRVDHAFNKLIFPTSLRDHIVTRLPPHLKNSLISVKMIQKKDFWGFTNFKDFNFARVTFKSLKGFRAGIKIFQSPVSFPGVKAHSYKLYESNIEPFLRMIHIRDIEPTGWVRIPAGKYNETSTLKTTCAIDVECNWKHLFRYENEKIAPFLVASFDIECTSSHGDFPVARKDYKKVANEIYQFYQENKEEDDIKSLIIDELIGIFTPAGAKTLSRVYPKEEVSLLNVKRKVQRTVDDLMTLLCERIKFTQTNTSAPDKTYGSLPLKMPTKRKEAEVEHKKPLTKEGIVKAMTEKLNATMPALQGDPIIQIGITAHRYGERDCSYKSIVTLDTCDPIEGVEVFSCKTEKELLLKWRDVITTLDPDIMIGYNIFGFDMSYLYERAVENDIGMHFMRLGRFMERECEFKEKMLSSSALGDNILKFIDMQGRVLIDIMKTIQRDHKLDSFKLDNVAHHFIGLNKNDVHPNDIFRLQKGSAADRKVVAEYCIQDCALCNKLLMKLEILANNIGMSNVCNVPLSYIFMRGQGIKIFSLVAKECKNEGFLIPTISKVIDKEEEDGYEGAIVLEPKTGIYIDDPVSVLDYASLYPSSMISENLSHDCIVIDPKYDNLPGVEYLNIAYDIYEGEGDKKKKAGERICRFVQLPDGEKGIIPQILMKLLKQRKETRKKIEWQTIETINGEVYKGLVKEDRDGYVVNGVIVAKENVKNICDTYDEFQKAVLDGLQLAYKVTANSLYGQIGARTSPIYLKDIAACTTATGRKMILMAKKFLEDNYSAEIVYGDTDSIFAIFPNKDENGNPLKGKQAIMRSIEQASKASKEFKGQLKAPHDLEYEKTFWPFVLFSKKRYCANKYEFDDKKCKMNSMGIVLKRRDNAPIVKHVYGGILDIILNEQNVEKSIEFLNTSLNNLIAGKYPLEDLVITKSLRADYKDPEKIAHKMLADRIKERDPGNAPNVNDRIPFVYIETPPAKKGQKVLQGERIETPDYIKQKALKPDYEFYITNQIMNPILQLYSLALSSLKGYNKNDEYWREVETKLFKEKNDIKKAKDKVQEMKETIVQETLFDPILTKIKNKKQGNRNITDFFTVMK